MEAQTAEVAVIISDEQLEAREIAKVKSSVEISLDVLRKDVLALEIKGVNDAIGYKQVVDKIKETSKYLVNLEKTRKATKKFYLEMGRKIDGAADFIESDIRESINILKAKQDKIDQEKKAIAEKEQREREAKINARIAALAKYSWVIDVKQAETMSDENFAQLESEAKIDFDKKQAVLAAAEANKRLNDDLLQKLKEQQEENERLKALLESNKNQQQPVSAPVETFEQEVNSVPTPVKEEVKLEPVKAESNEAAQPTVSVTNPDKKKLQEYAERFINIKGIIVETPQAKDLLARFTTKIIQMGTHLKNEAEKL